MAQLRAGLFQLFAGALLLARTALLVQSLAPPLHKSKESVAAYRKRMNITWHYQPRHLHPEHCRYMDEQQCQSLDETMAMHSERARRNHNDRRLQVNSAPNSGDITVFVILCRFNNHLDRTLPPASYFDKLFNGGETDPASKLYEAGSISDWLYQQSLGRYKAKFVIAPEWVTLPATEQYYAAGVSGLQGPEVMQEMIKPVLDHWYTEMGFTEFYKFDSKGWGVLDHLVAIHSGHGAEIGKIEEMPKRIPNCGAPDQQDRIWAQGTTWTGPGHWRSSDYAFEART